MAIFPGTAITPAAGGAGYTIDQSLRGNQADSSYLNRTPSSASNRKTYTISAWIKPSLEVATFSVLGAGSTGSAYYIFGIEGNDLYFEETSGGGSLRSNMILRDPSAWYHLMASVDSTQATASDRIKLYVNGVQETSFSTESYMAQNRDSSYINNTGIHYIGRSPAQSSHYLNGYLSEVHFIDGQALDPSYFGEADETYGHWKPIAYEGTYGTNGFYLDFSNSGSIGEDQAGSNDWTANNLAATDVVLDSPTNNFPTWNPLAVGEGGQTYLEGNTRTLVENTAAWHGCVSNIGASSGKWYAEFVASGSANDPVLGVVMTQTPRHPGTGAYGGAEADTGIGFSESGSIYTQGSATNKTNSGWTEGNVIGIALDLDSGTVDIYENNSLIGGADNIDSGVYYFGYGNYAIGTVYANFGQDSSFAGNKTAQNNTDANGVGDFYYAPPTGFLALCTANLSDPAVVPGENFNTVLYTGTGSAQTISGVGFQPDFIWLKDRSTSNFAHYLTDAIRGFDKYLFSNLTNAEGTNATRVTSVNSDGFAIGNDGAINTNTSAHVAWNWKANNTSGSSNTDGSITSTVAANVDAGFSIVSYTGDGAATATVGHGLSVAPSMVIIKNRDSGTASWPVYHEAIASSYLTLNSTGAGTSGQWISADTDTINFSTLSSWTNTSTNDYIAYAFHSVEGFSKFGSYTGNGSTDGPFVYTGFRPAFVIWKNASASTDWHLRDTKMSPYNVSDEGLFPNGSYAESTDPSYAVDILSNGFKPRNGTGAWNNASGATYIYMAFAEYPFKFTNAR